MMDRKQLLETAIRASIEAGKAILEVYDSADFNVEMKSDDSPLTKADLKSNECIEAHLNATEVKILSEEGAEIKFEERKAWKQLWIVDPLDGTKEFIKRNGEFTVNIALVEDNSPSMGVIYVPVTRTLYYSDTNLGAYKIVGPETDNLDELIQSSAKLGNQEYPSTYTLVASRSHMSDDTLAFVDEKKQEYGEVNTVSMGSSLKICLVAENKAHAYPRYAPTMEWDTAAGHAIVKGAGKELYDYETKQPMLYNRKELRNNWFLVE